MPTYTIPDLPEASPMIIAETDTHVVIVVEIAKHLLGPDWLPAYVRKANEGGIERVLV